MTARQITEQDHVHDQWYEDARKVTLETLPEFLRHLTEDYVHDYGTICHAVAAGSVAAAWVVDHAPCGGITGFQAGAVMWEFVKHWLGEKGPLRLVRYEHMLFPQYAGDFDRTISSDVWEWLQTEAKRELELLYRSDNTLAMPRVIKHWQNICDGKVPFGYRVDQKGD